MPHLVVTFTIVSACTGESVMVTLTVIHVGRYNALCPPSLQIDCAFLYGFAYFRQVKDRSLRRGYFQKVTRAEAVPTAQCSNTAH